MGDKYYAEDLLDKLSLFKHDAPSLFQDGELSSSIDFFRNLSQEDQRILIYLALTEGDKDVQNVANRLRGLLPSNPQELLAQISPRDKAELEDLLKDRQLKAESLTADNMRKIARELQEASSRIGFLELEEAFWVLIPDDSTEKTLWIEAAGGNGQVLDRLRLSSQVVYDLTAEEEHDLITAMQKALWILHVHNHPELMGYITYCQPSPADQRFASHWKSVSLETKDKMKFFVVKGKDVVEYSLPLGETKSGYLESLVSYSNSFFLAVF